MQVNSESVSAAEIDSRVEIRSLAPENDNSCGKLNAAMIDLRGSIMISGEIHWLRGKRPLYRASADPAWRGPEATGGASGAASGGATRAGERASERESRRAHK